ncbi:MAG: biotin/lipoate A/B protein ligase family protein [Candidatus Thermoplasmatota archaeon]|nr:biotin/lipoate A/B protein ligase family protein [Candidatus Thermoplasmatota archaeon]
MARDEAVFRSVIAGEDPCLRFYQWDPPGLSLGRFQRVEEVDMEACSRWGVEAVRRLTGGEAVLHDDELTYSIAIRLDHPAFDGIGVVDTYKTISRALVKGLGSIGVKASIAIDGAMRADPAGQGICFYTPTANEVVSGGRKIIGSAQTRERMVILQHGSIPLSLDVDRLLDVTGIASDKREVMRAMVMCRATSVCEQLGTRVEARELVPHLMKGFEEVFGIASEISEYSMKEKKMSQLFVRDRYGNDAWNLKI